MILPEEIVEWVAAGVNLCDHFIEVSAEFVYTHLFSCGNEDARRIFLSYPAVVNGNQKCSDFGNSECSIFGIKTTVLLASAVQ